MIDKLPSEPNKMQTIDLKIGNRIEVQPVDLKTAEGLKTFMSESTSVDDWNLRIEKVKEASGGDYPSFWNAATRGVLGESMARWREASAPPGSALNKSK